MGGRYSLKRDYFGRWIISSGEGFSEEVHLAPEDELWLRNSGIDEVVVEYSGLGNKYIVTELPSGLPDARELMEMERYESFGANEFSPYRELKEKIDRESRALFGKREIEIYRF